MRLIDADALGLDINRKANENFPANRNLTLYAESLLAHAPTIDAVPVVHGRWVSKDSRYPFSWRYCSECGYHVTASMARNYKGCPICLARMDGENVDG